MSRFDHIAYDLESVSEQQLAEGQVVELEAVIERLDNSREKSLALTKLEECYMWIGKAIRNEQVSREYIRKLNSKGDK